MLAAYFHDYLGFSRSAIVQTPNGSWINQITSIYSSTLTSLGRTITSHPMAGVVSDFRTILTAIKTDNPEGIGDEIATTIDFEGVKENNPAQLH